MLKDRNKLWAETFSKMEVGVEGGWRGGKKKRDWHAIDVAMGELKKQMRLTLAA